MVAERAALSKSMRRLSADSRVSTSSLIFLFFQQMLDTTYAPQCPFDAGSNRYLDLADLYDLSGKLVD